MEDIIEVLIDNDKSILKYKNLCTKCYIGKKGYTNNPFEGDQKTPLGVFSLGIAFGIKNDINTKLDYTVLNDNLYWVDDPNSKYYNMLVDITKTNKDWHSAEHLLDYKIQYEYGIEIKTNPSNIKGMGSAIFLHCQNKPYTMGCISIPKEDLIYILENVNKDAKISIKKC